MAHEMTGSARSPGWRALVAILGAVLVLAVAAAPAGATDGTADDGGDAVVVELFWMQGCPHCHAEWELLDELAARYPDLVVENHEVSASEEARQRFVEAGIRHGFEPRAVPTTIIDGVVWVGFDARTAAEIEAAVVAAVGSPPTTAAPSGPAVDGTADEAADEAELASGEIIDVPFVGEVDLGGRSLVMATLLIGFVDGVNPCSLWVMSVLLGLVLHSGSRRRVLAVGSVFLAVTTAMYGFYIAGVYTLLAYVAYLAWIQRGVAVIAATIGAVNVWSWAFPGRGPSLSISDRHKPGIYRRGRELARADTSIWALLGATAVLAVGVSLAETPCTAGFPIVWTGLLADAEVGAVTAVALFALYMAVFLVDELVIFAGIVVTMRAVKLQEHQGRALKLLSGVVMLALAGAMAFAPDLLSSVGGTAALFGGAGLLTLLVLAVERVVGHRAVHPHPAG